jgi:hypothetical protein
LAAPVFITVVPMVTCPSPAIATCPSRRTQSTVVERIWRDRSEAIEKR